MVATVVVPTMRAKVDPNPRGSATTHVTMPSANPFERETVAIRQANQPMLHSMMPGMGGLGLDAPAPAPATAPATTSGWGSFWQGTAQSIIQNIAIPAIQQEVIKQPSQTMTAPASTSLTSTAPRALTTSSTSPMLVYGGPAPAPAKPSMAPWIIGGVGLAAVAGILLIAKGKKGGGRRRRR